MAPQEIWQPYIGDESSPGKGLQTDPYRSSGLKMGGNKEQDKGTGFPQATMVRRGC